MEGRITDLDLSSGPQGAYRYDTFVKTTYLDLVYVVGEQSLVRDLRHCVRTSISERDVFVSMRLLFQLKASVDGTEVRIDPPRNC